MDRPYQYWSQTIAVIKGYSVCVYACPKFAAFKSSSYHKVDLPASFSNDFLDFQFMVSFLTKRPFHSYFVVSNSHKRLCILHSTISNVVMSALNLTPLGVWNVWPVCNTVHVSNTFQDIS